MMRWLLQKCGVQYGPLPRVDWGDPPLRRAAQELAVAFAPGWMDRPYCRACQVRFVDGEQVVAFLPPGVDARCVLTHPGLCRDWYAEKHVGEMEGE